MFPNRFRLQFVLNAEPRVCASLFWLKRVSPGYRRGSRSRGTIPSMRRRLFMSLAVLALVLIATVIGIGVLPPASEHDQDFNSIRCMIELQTIGERIRRYRQDHAGMFPSDLETLSRHSSSQPATWTPRKQLCGALPVYLGGGSEWREGDRRVVIYLPPATGRPEFLVLFDDGTTDLIDPSRGGSQNAKTMPTTDD